jgi:hypothetical protein
MWTLVFYAQPPDTITLRAHGEDGMTLAEDEFSLEWTRVGGTEECGGPTKAGPLQLTV